ncbi:MAG: 2-amino-4-hydroxy-6-hydroxymethyldihydropteridine diphosphokinase [Desulfobacterales bacterium]|nr:2-amino-4-hydroxy-6-hydroxymethyldihydropteridine diphosphokinase [Desulfobacterales bacterium]
MRTRVFIGLGANLGNGLVSLPRAWDRIGRLDGIVCGRLSSPFRTMPKGMDSRRKFINAVGELFTDLGPEAVLAGLLAVEKEWGRVRGPSDRYQDRPLDLDIIFYGKLIFRTKALSVPHPRCTERLFVLAPLAELAPDFRHPVSGYTVARLLDQHLTTNAGRAEQQGLEKPAWPDR